MCPRDFLAAFPGRVLYAVKANPEPRVLAELWAAGIRYFDTASPGEMRAVHARPAACCRRESSRSPSPVAPWSPTACRW